MYCRLYFSDLSRFSRSELETQVWTCEARFFGPCLSDVAIIRFVHTCLPSPSLTPTPNLALAPTPSHPLSEGAGPVDSHGRPLREGSEEEAGDVEEAAGEGAG